MTRVTAALAMSLVLLLALLAAPPASAQEAPDYVIVDPAIGEDFTPIPGAAQFSGTLETDGAAHGYRIEVPEGDAWNGSLVLYAHGFVGPQQAELIVQSPPLREFFIAQGYAWAASSYSANGYVIEEGVEQTHDLLASFTELTGLDAPTQTIFHGFSMGGHITGRAIEARPDAYDGALPACGVMGDAALFDYFADVNLAAGALSGVDVPFPGDLSFLGGTAQQVTAALGLLDGLSTPAGVQYAGIVEALSGGERPTFEESLAFWNGPAAVDLGEGGRVPFLQALYGRALSAGLETPPGISESYDNTATIYGFPNATSPEPSAEEQALNAAILRVAGDAAPTTPVIEGTPQIPVLSIHTTGDLFVPMQMQRIYAEEVAANGLSDNLVQRTMRAAGHCDFTGVELATAFTDLVTWMATDTAPAGEDLLDPAVTRDRDLGCAWTSETRPGMPACEDPTATTLAGDDAVATAIAASSGRTTATTAVIARADVYADALSGSSLAGALDAPLLLNPVDAVDPRVAAELTRLGVTDVVLLGGAAALSPAVEAGLADAGLTVTRVQGSNRWATAGAVADAVVAATGPADRVFLASGEDFADAVAVSGLAAFTGDPILLTRTAELPVEAQTALAALGDPSVVVVGGEAAVSADQPGDLRLAGANRYGTSAAVVDFARNAGMRINQPWLATGEAFADALVAGPASAAAGQVLVLVDGDDLAGSAGEAGTNELLGSLAGQVAGLTVVSTGGAVADSSTATLLDGVTGPVQPL